MLFFPISRRKAQPLNSIVPGRSLIPVRVGSLGRKNATPATGRGIHNECVPVRVTCVKGKGCASASRCTLVRSRSVRGGSAGSRVFAVSLCSRFSVPCRCSFMSIRTCCNAHWFRPTGAALRSAKSHHLQSSGYIQPSGWQSAATAG